MGYIEFSGFRLLNMYNREYEYYKLLSCDSDDFKIYEAKVSETGFEIGVIISNIEKPVKIENPENKDYYNVKLYGEEYIITNNDEYNDLINPIQITKFNYADGENGKASYVQNENGKKYYCVLNPSRKAKNSFINGNKFDFYDTFEMTKYEATDKIKIILYYYGKPVTIQLQKIK